MQGIFLYQQNQFSIPYQKYQEYPDINPQVQDQDFRPPPMPRFSNLKQDNDYFVDKNNKR